MKKTTYSIGEIRFAPQSNSRRMGTHIQHNRAFRSEGKKLQLKTEGLEGDNLAFVTKLNERFGELPGILSPTEIDAEIKEANKDMVNKSDLNTKTIIVKGSGKEGEADKTLDEFMREQADKMTKLQNELKALGGEQFAMDIQTLVSKMMPDIEKAFQTKQGIVEMNVSKAAAVMTTANTIDETTFSVPVALLESFSMNAFVGKRYGKQWIGEVADIVNVSNMEEYTTWLEEGSEQGAFAIVAEGALKPLVSYGLVRNFAHAQKIAGKYVVTEEFAKFRANAYNIIRRLIMDKMTRDYSALIVTGINAASAGYTGTILDDTIVDPNDYDAIGAVAAQIASLNFVPNVLVLNPQDAWRIRLEKDADGRYLFPTVTQDGQTQIFAMQLVESTYQTAGYFTLAEKGLYKVEQEGITIRAGYGVDVTGSNPVTTVVSDFDNNRFRTIVEMFFKQWLPTPYVGSVVRAQFSVVKAALDATV